MSFPSMFSSGPPELPGLIDASVWMKSVNVRPCFVDGVVRDDAAVARPDEAGAERLRFVFAVAAKDAEGIEEGVDLAPPDGRLGLDIDDRGQDVVRDDDDGRAPRGADRLRNRGAL